MAIGKENFMWECSSICPHRWGELASERPTWASHTTTNSRSEQISTEQICWFLLQQKGCLRYISIFQQTSSFQSLSIDKVAGKTVVQNINASDFYCTSQIAVIGLAYCFRENRKQERMADDGCLGAGLSLSVGNQWYLFNYWMNLISSTAVITDTD